MKLLTLALLATAATPALAQTTPTTPAPTTPAQNTPAPSAGAPVAPAVGVTVVDTQGGQVGTIEAINGDLATINTGTNKVGFPVASMTAGPNGPIVAVTKAQLDASFAEQVAKGQAILAQKLVAGTPVKTLNGAMTAGTVKAADGEFVTLTTSAGKDVRLPKSGFSLDAQQNVIIGLTAEQFNAAVAGTGA